MEEFILEKVATLSHLEGNININQVPLHLLPDIGQIVNIILGNLVVQSTFIHAGSFRINNVNIGNWLQENQIQVGDTYAIKIINKNTFEFLINV